MVRDILDPEFKKSYHEMTVNQVYYEYVSLGIEADKWYLFNVPELGNVNGSVHIKDNLLTLCAGTLQPYDERSCRLFRAAPEWISAEWPRSDAY